MPKLRVVLDSSVLVSAFLTPGGSPARLVALAAQGDFLLFLSRGILEETERALLRPRNIDRYRYDSVAVERFGRGIIASGSVLDHLPAVEGVVARDPADDQILACARAAAADRLVTGDRDLLTLGSYEGVAIVTPGQFLAELADSDR